MLTLSTAADVQQPRAKFQLPHRARLGILALGFCLMAALSGCATMIPTHSSDIRKLYYGMSGAVVNTTLKQPVAFTLKFALGPDTYQVGGFRTGDVHRTYVVVMKDDRLTVLLDESSLQKPLFRSCLAFPPQPTLDVRSCLAEGEQSAEHMRLDLASINPTTSDPSFAEDQRESVGGIAMMGVMTAIMPTIMVPVYVLQTPWLIYESAGNRDLVGKAKTIKLGEGLISVENTLSKPPASMQSVVGLYQVDLFPFGAPAIPGIAVGAINGKIIWIELSPPAACGGHPYSCHSS